MICTAGAADRRKIAKQFGSFDGLDNRRSLWGMLERLGDGVSWEQGYARRREVLQWCSQQCKGPFGKPVNVTDDGMVTTSDAYWILVGMATCYELDLDMVARKIDRWLSKLGR